MSMSPDAVSRMNPEVKAIWLEALNSGRFQKGKGWLRLAFRDREDEYCCLGVLCELAVEAKVIPPPNAAEWRLGVEVYVHAYYQNQKDHVSSWRSTKMLPAAVTGWAGLASSDGEFLQEDSFKDSLVRINDRSDTFAPVIAAIEEYF